jgi:hypothetical protein
VTKQIVGMRWMSVPGLTRGKDSRLKQRWSSSAVRTRWTRRRAVHVSDFLYLVEFYFLFFFIFNAEAAIGRHPELTLNHRPKLAAVDVGVSTPSSPANEQCHESCANAHCRLGLGSDKVIVRTADSLEGTR